MNILIVKLSAIGDVIHTLPALNALRAHYPFARITWLVEEAASDLVIGHRALDRVLVSRRKTWIRGLFSGDAVLHFKAAAFFLKNLRDTRYDMILDFHGLLKSSLLIFLARGKRKIGFGKGMAHMEYSHLFLNERIPAVSMEYHALKRQLIFLEGLGIRCSRIVYDVPIRMQDRKEAGQLLASCGIQPDAVYVAINPGAKWVTKLWEPGKFARVADDLIRRHSVRIIFTGSREDSAMVGAIRGRMKEPAAGVTGKTTLNVLSAIYENAACVLSTDTGPMHLAAAVGTPVVALFGPTAPSRTGPFGKRHRVLRTKMACSPCFKRECLLKRHGANVTALCMEQISVQDVIEAVEGRMDEMGKG
ncbi:MAG: lipopolysaccharide heptosyltransferase I [Desulfobacterales bacterium CG23_combo_of_CG06-09_8_20_14_all_52_9]|nr:MAG: lipopolysaccharide heptosyltransferase I [Desulfobacterales bacterium CG23_combo_of_CG06-09_8_20_14_all_52_9]